MSHHRSLINNQLNSNRDPRTRDRSRSEIRRSDTSETILPSVPTTQAFNHEQSGSTNGSMEFFKALGLSPQLIQALINTNPQNSQPMQQQPPSSTVIHSVPDFARFLSNNYGLNQTFTPTPDQPVNRDPRRRPRSNVSNPTNSNPIVVNSNSSNFDQAIDPHSYSCETNDTYPNTFNYLTPSKSIDEQYKNYLSSIDQSLLDDETRKRFQRIALLDDELDKLHRMNIILTKSSERHSRRRSSTKDQDPLLRENENLQNELIEYIKTLKTTVMSNYPIYMFFKNEF